MNRFAGRSVLSYMRKLRAGAPPPQVSEEVRTASHVFAMRCTGCHAIGQEGGRSGPELTHIGRKRDAEWLRHLTALRPTSIPPPTCRRSAVASTNGK